MKSYRHAVGISLLLAFALCAFSVSGASAADRAYTCVPTKSVSPEPQATFTDAHCLTAKSPTGGEGFAHVLITVKPTAEMTLSNEKTAASTTASSPAVLKSHIAGVETAITCSTVMGTGQLSNGATSVSGTGTIEYSGCTVSLPAGKGCKVTGGAITTKELAATTEGTTGTRVKFTPKTGTEFAAVPIEGCEKERPPKGNYVVEGTFEAPTTGATTAAGHSEITAQGTLLFGGTVAGLEGAVTLTMKGGNAVALTP